MVYPIVSTDPGFLTVFTFGAGLLVSLRIFILILYLFLYYTKQYIVVLHDHPLAYAK